MSAEGKMKWGDSIDDEIKSERTDENGNKIIEEIIEKDGKKFKVTKRIVTKTTKVPRGIIERKKWKNFGDPQSANTTFEDVQLEIVFKTQQQVQEKPDTAEFGIVCRYCGVQGEHWSHKCPHRHLYESSGVSIAKPSPLTGEPSGDSKGKKYVAPGARGSGGMPSGSSIDAIRQRKDDSTIRVTNLSEDTIEDDLHNIFGSFGSIQRVFLAKDKITGAAKGFAFITYVSRHDAEKAINKMNGYGLNHLIIQVEWSKPSTPR